MGPEKISSKRQAWFCTTGLQSDVIIEVDDMAFHLHKFPLMSKSRKLHELISEQQKKSPAKIRNPSETCQKVHGDAIERSEIQENGEEDEEQRHIIFPDFPGGCEAFEAVARFCYGLKLDLSAANAAALRCAGEYLEMTEEYSKNNLITKTESFISQSVLKNINCSIKALASSQGVMPMAENLGIVQRCIDAVADKAALSDPSLFGWPVNDGVVSYKGGGDAVKLDHVTRTGVAGGGSWLDDLGLLAPPLFKRLIFAMNALNLNCEIVESCLIHYAKKYIPGISRGCRKPPPSSSPTEREQREILEMIISSLPMEKTSPSSPNITRLLFGILRTAYILNISDRCRLTLEKKIGLQLEQAALDDVLIPSYSYLNETLYDVDCVERILGFFLQRLENRSGEDQGTGVRSAELILVGKLIDGYLSEIASDANLKPEKFYDLCMTMPDHARLFDDGLYRAVDVYLKAHPWISEPEREKICGVLDCQKLTLEACTHAAQNERLPLRAVVQVLFFEQLQLRHAIAGTLLATHAGTAEVDGGEEDEDKGENSAAAEGRRSAALRQNQVMRVDMDSMRTRVQELEKECTTMKQAMEKIDDKAGGQSQTGHVEKGGWRAMFGCKFTTQVCDSHESTAVHTEKTRRHRRRHHRKQ